MSTTVFDEQQEVLGTHIRIKIILSTALDERRAQAASEALKAAFEECHRLDREYSRFRDNNQLTKLNAQLNVWQEVSPEFFFLLKQGQEIGQKTNGAFNFAVKKLLEQWGYDKNYSFQSSSTATDKKELPLVPYELSEPQEKFENGPQKFQAKLLQPIELGGLGKGYALDLIAEKLQGFHNVCIDAGGDLYARGKNEKGESWNIYFEHPLDQETVIGEVKVDDFYLAASNPLKRRWANYHHLVDPKSQRPADQMLAVYTQAKTGLLADAYSTALFVLGFENAKKLLPSLPIEAMLISPSGEVYHSPGFQGEFFS